MISPHLLDIIYSYSSSHPSDLDKKGAKGIPGYLGWDVHTSVHSEETPVLVLGDPNKDTKWVHAILVEGPPLNDEEGIQVSALIIIWWSQMGPDTDRVFSVVNWEKHARNRK
jgi:hypothetical protein